METIVSKSKKSHIQSGNLVMLMIDNKFLFNFNRSKLKAYSAKN